MKKPLKHLSAALVLVSAASHAATDKLGDATVSVTVNAKTGFELVIDKAFEMTEGDEAKAQVIGSMKNTSTLPVTYYLKSNGVREDDKGVTVDLTDENGTTLPNALIVYGYESRGSVVDDHAEGTLEPGATDRVVGTQTASQAASMTAGNWTGQLEYGVVTP